MAQGPTKAKPDNRKCPLCRMYPCSELCLVPFSGQEQEYLTSLLNQQRKQGMHLVLEGINGSGKTHQIDLLRAHFENQGRTVIVVRDPGTTSVGEKLRGILLHPQENEVDQIHANTQLALFTASRTQLYHQVVKPALMAGYIVLGDRWDYSTIAYQCITNKPAIGEQGISVNDVMKLTALLTGNHRPKVIVLDIAADTALDRRKKMAADKPDQFEGRGLEFQTELRYAYQAAAAFDRENSTIINGDQSPEEVHQNILKVINHSAPSSVLR